MFKTNLPANKYMTPVMSIALICRWHTPNAPTKAALPNIIKHTSEHEIDKFCIPEKNKKKTSFFFNIHSDLLKTKWKTFYFIDYKYNSQIFGMTKNDKII